MQAIGSRPSPGVASFNAAMRDSGHPQAHAIPPAKGHAIHSFYPVLSGRRAYHVRRPADTASLGEVLAEEAEICRRIRYMRLQALGFPAGESSISKIR